MWDTSQAQIQSKADPISVRSIRSLAIEVWRRAEGMGLVEANASSLDAAGITKLLKRVRDAPRDGRVFVVFGESSGLVGWKAVEHGAPPVGLLERVNRIAN